MKLKILALSFFVVFLTSCGLYKLFTSVNDSATKIEKTLDKIDEDHDDILSFQEILLYLLSGWGAGRVAEAGGVAIFKKKKKKDNE
jgi:hypothetical protein